MTTVLDVAAYLLQKYGPMTAMKLQKLAYYAQAWSLVWDEKPLFEERIEAWANGPVCPALYDAHRGQFNVRFQGIDGDPTLFDDSQTETLDSVLSYYGDKSSQWLSRLVYAEAPWKDTREGLEPADRGKKVITLAAMGEYYGSLC